MASATALYWTLSHDRCVVYDASTRLLLLPVLLLLLLMLSLFLAAVFLSGVGDARLS